MNPHRTATGSRIHAGRADMILHVAATQHAARIDIFESAKNFHRRTVHDIDDHVQASAMTHRQHGLLGAIARRGVQNLVQQRNQRRVAFQRVALSPDVAGMDGLLEHVCADQLVQNAAPVDGLLPIRLHAFLNPLPPLEIRNVHELDTDAAAVNATRGIGYIAGDIQFGMSQRGEVPQRIEICLKIAPAPERVQDALLFLAVNIHHDGRQGSTTPRLAPIGKRAA